MLGDMTTQTGSGSAPLDLLTREECAEVLRVSLSTVGKLIRAGHIYSFRVGRAVRVPKAALEAYQRGEHYLSTGDQLQRPDLGTWPPTPALDLGGDQ